MTDMSSTGQVLDKAAIVERLRAMPAAMREKQQWLLWRFELKAGEEKPRKVPHYVSGRKRRGAQGSEEDRAELATLEAALATYQRSRMWDGLGFAFLPGDGLVGIDIDGVVDPDTGEISQRCQDIVKACGSYTEWSPSRRGVHIIVAGETKTFKDNSIGLEVFCGRQFFTCTGEAWPDMPAEVHPLDERVLRRLKATVDQAKGKGKKAATPPAVVQAPALAPSAPAAPAPDTKTGTDDFRRVNDAALRQLDVWVPSLLPLARKQDGTGAWRVSSKDLGRSLEEDLSIAPDGIVDFGVADMGDARQGKRSAVDLVMEHRSCSNREALHWLAEQLRITLTPPKKTRAKKTPPPDESAHASTTGEEGEAPEDEEAPSGKKSKKKPQSWWDAVHGLQDHFALIYGTDTAWDGRHHRIVKISALRLAYGTDVVKYWLNSGQARRTILPEHLVFEPQEEIGRDDERINMWRGLDLKPTACDDNDVAPMIELLNHLCGISADTADEVDAVVNWVLCWCALPLQQPGTKMQTALVFHGPQGTGKNLFFDAWRDLYGEYGITVGQTELEDKFNDWISRKLAIVGDEVVSRAEMYHNKNRLKLVVTQETKFPIRAIQQSVRWESNHANVVFLSNENQPLALEERDRRYMVVYTPTAEDGTLYARVAAFLRDGGLAKWLHFLLSYPLDGFDRHTKPIMTKAKATLVEMGWLPSQKFAHDWLEGFLPLPIRVCSAEQLYAAFRRWADQAGERFVPARDRFTREVERFTLERVERDASGRKLPPRLTYKVITLKHADGTRKSKRCWLPTDCGPREGVSEGEWARESIEDFEQHLSKYTRRHGLDPEPTA